MVTFIIRVYQSAVAGKPAVQRIIRSNGASARALAAIADGINPWRALWQYGGVTFRGWMPYPSWTDPGPQG